jgi:hypothetical protein
MRAFIQIRFLFLFPRLETLVMKDEHRNNSCVDEESSSNRAQNPSNFNLANISIKGWVNKATKCSESIGNQEGHKKYVNLFLFFKQRVAEVAI